MSPLDRSRRHKCQLCLSLPAALGVTALGTDLPALMPNYGLRGVGGFIAKLLCISHSGCSHPPLCLVACKCLRAAEPRCPLQSTLLPHSQHLGFPLGSALLPN